MGSRAICFSALCLCSVWALAPTLAAAGTRADAFNEIDSPCVNFGGSEVACSVSGSVANNLVTYSGSGSSYANSATGDLTANAESSGAYSGVYPNAYGYAATDAEIYDTLTFQGPIDANSTVTITMTGIGNYSPGFFSTTYGHTDGLAFGVTQITVYDMSGTLLDRKTSCGQDTPVGPLCGLVDRTYTPFNSISVTMDLNTEQTVEVEFSVAAYAKGDASASVHDPITITMPEGVSFTSASGKFLTEVPSTPEPATWAMVLFGFLGLGFMARRWATQALAGSAASRARNGRSRSRAARCSSSTSSR